jgi:lipopolysaccharide exporter
LLFGGRVAERVSVGRKTAHAAAWGLATTAGSRGLTFVSFAILARILAPHEFGLLAFAMAYIAYAETIGDLGSGTALVYWPDRRDDAAQITFMVNAVAGVFWCLLSFALAPWVAHFFNAPNGAPLVRALGLSFPIKFLGTAHDALAQKDLRFRARALPELGFAGIKAAVAISLALMGFGAWSLIWGHLAGLASQTIFAWMIVPWRPSLTFPRDLLRPMLNYGRSIMWTNILHAISSDADLAFVGHYLGVTALGLYQMAARITETGVSVVLRVISKVLFPAFAKLHGAGEQLRTPFLFATHLVPAITFPAAIGIAVLAKPIIAAAFGPKWLAAAPTLALLAVYIGIQTLANHAGDLLKATGRANLLVILSVFRSILVLSGLWIAAPHGIEAIAGSLVVTATITTSILTAMACRIIHVSFAAVARAYLPSMLSVGAMAIAVLLWKRVGERFTAWPDLLSGVAVGMIVYLVTLRITDPDIFAWTKRTLLRRPPEPAPV